MKNLKNIFKIMNILYYIGAGDDMSYLSFPYKEYRLYDGLPSSNYYEECHHGYKLQINFVKIITKRLKNRGFVLIFKRANKLIYKNKNGMRIVYNYNHKWSIDDMKNVPDNSDIYIRGFAPEINIEKFNKVYITKCVLDSYTDRDFEETNYIRIYDPYETSDEEEYFSSGDDYL